MKLFQEFRAFAMRGNAIDLAVGVVVGAAFTGIVNSLVKDIINPPLGLIIAGPVADRFGVQIWFVLGGIITLVMATASLFIPAVMNFEQGRKIATPATDTEAAPSPTPAD